MKNNLFFDFTIDEANNRIHISREFAAEQALVWDAFTKQEILDQWWGPKPVISRTIAMDFAVGGQRFYKMVTPEGQEHFGIQKYTAIDPQSRIVWLTAFTDKDGNINAQLPSSEWELLFSEENGTTTVRITIQQDSLANIEIAIQMGFKEGFTMILNALDTLLDN